MSRTRVLLTLAVATGLAFVFLLSSCAFTSDRSGTLVGTVRSEQTALPISSAEVECAGELTFSNSSGEYELDGISPGQRVVYARAAGFVEYSRVVEIEETTILDITMEIYVPPSRLFGYVTHATFGSLEGATVQVGDLTTQTDAAGYYEFPNALQTTYDLTVTKDGYRPFSRSVTLNSSDYQYDVALKYLAAATLPVVADATIFSEAPDANSGDYALLQLFDNGVLRENCLVTVDMTGLEETADPVLATLRLFHTEEEGSEAARTMMVARILDPWDEMTVTWLNAPRTTGPSSVSSVYVDNWFEADVTDCFEDWMNFGATNNGLYLDTVTDHSSGRFYFASREYFLSDVHPHVVLDYAW